MAEPNIPTMNQTATLLKLAPTLSPQEWRGYQSNLPRHLIGVARYQQSRLMHWLIEERGHQHLSLHFEPYISLAVGKGIGLTDLAEALSVSRQAVNQTVNQIEKVGYLRRETDPADGRARRAVLTEHGRQLIDDGAELLARVDQEFTEILGKPGINHLREDLQTLCASLGFEPAGSGARRSTLGWLLPRISNSLMQELMRRTRAKGHPGLKMSYGQVLTLMAPEGGRIQEMARINEVSKQAISVIARELEDLGYLQRRTDPRDARQVILGFTPAGIELLQDSIASVNELEARFAQALGGENLTRLSQQAQQLYAALGQETEEFGSDQNVGDLALDIMKKLGKRNSKLLAQRLLDAVEVEP